LGVVVSDRHYPTGSSDSAEIRGLAELAKEPDTMVFHAATQRNAGGVVVNSGGRVLTAGGMGNNVAAIRGALFPRLTQHLGGNPQLRWRGDIGYHEG
jgi:phosphoribosylamine-glycine ligase